MITDDPKKNALSLVLDIIQSQMALEPERCLIYDQKWNLPPDDGLHITAQFLGAMPYSNRAIVENRGDAGFFEVQDANFKEMYQITVMSRSTEALFKKQFVLMALASIKAQQVQEENSFRIATIPTGFTDISEIEGAALIYKFAITLNVLTWYKTERLIDYYNDFPGELWVDPRNTEANAIPFNVPPAA